MVLKLRPLPAHVADAALRLSRGSVAQAVEQPPGAVPGRCSVPDAQNSRQGALDEDGQEDAEARGVEAAPVDRQARAVVTQIGDKTGGCVGGPLFPLRVMEAQTGSGVLDV